MFSLSSSTINPKALKKSLATPEAGACVCFEGWVRNHNEGIKVTALEYEARETLCQTEAEKIIKEAQSSFRVQKISCAHRMGKLNVGELSLWIGVSADHRDEAFKACRYLIDQIKLRLPIWKKEYYPNGNSAWISAQDQSQPAGRPPTAVASVHTLTDAPAERMYITINEIPKDQVNQYTFVDIRELIEREMEPPPMESIHLPLSQSQTSQFIFKDDKKYLIFCAKGFRSLKLTKHLRDQGHRNVYSLNHGIDDLVSYFSSND